MRKSSKYDFGGWATRNDLRCADGRTIRRDAFKDCDGKTVPLVWNHIHNDPFNVLGHALLENRKDGVYAYVKFNDTDQGRNGKALVEHGDVTSLSIYANQLKQRGGDVLHGVIREVSLVLSGANPGATIDTESFAHSGSSSDEALIYTGSYIDNFAIEHSDDDEEEDMEDDRTVGEIFDTLDDDQKDVVYGLIGQALEEGAAANDEDHDDEDFDEDYDDEDYDDEDYDEDEDFDDEEDERMKHNVFDSDYYDDDAYLSHSDEEDILEMAKSNTCGSLKAAINFFEDTNGLQHDAISSGFSQDGDPANVSLLFPEYKDVRPGAPELVTSDQGWIGTVMNKVHKSPISRIRTGQVDIRNIDELRARGYEKGKSKKQTGNFNLVRRTTDPQTIYVKSALHRDDIIDITDFDYVQYLYNIDKMQLNEELATAIMIGDGRADESEDKIHEEHIRSIWHDDELYTMHYDIDLNAAKEELQGSETGGFFGENYILAEAMVNACLYSREKYKGTGTPDMFITPHMLNVMLLARDRNGRRIYSSKAELASALNVNNIFTAEQFVNKTRTDGEGAKARTKKLHALIVNLADYSLGATKGGQISHFTQFDIDFNQQKSLLETRCSGALTRIYSAIAIEEDVTKAEPDTP